MRKLGLGVMLVVVMALALPMGSTAQTTVPGHQKARYDQDGNGYPDAGVVVTGRYTSVYAYDASGAYYWDLGDGRVYTSSVDITSIEDLNQMTLTQCNYQVQYRGSFENNPYQDTGWVKNNIRCHGFDGTSTYTYLFVHETDPRYTGEPYRDASADFGAGWEYHILTESGSGNVVRPQNHVGG